MSVYKPFFQVQITHAGTTYDNQIDESSASFLRVRNGNVKRATGQTASVVRININNPNGVYNAFSLDDRVEIWTGFDPSGSDKVKVFLGTVTRIEKKKTKARGFFIDLEAKDATVDLANGSMFLSFSPGDVLTGGDGISYTLNDYGQAIKYIMSFTGSDQANPGKVTTTNVQNTGNVFSTKQIFSYTPTSKIIQSYAQINNFDYFVDSANDLHFQSKNYNLNSTPLNGLTNIESIEEVRDMDDEKNRIILYAGKTTDDRRVVGIYSVVQSGVDKVKAVHRSNVSIAPNAAGSTSDERYANAKLMAREQARLEYEKVKSRHTYRVTINQMITITLGDIFAITDTLFGLNNVRMRCTEIEENFSKTEPYKGILMLDTNLV